MQLEVQRASSAADIPKNSTFRRWAVAALDSPYTGHTLTIRVVDEGEGRDMNRQYRGRDRATNVLSFPAPVPDPMPPGVAFRHIGDLVICAPVVFAEAAAQGKQPEHHWAHLTVHGVLHLVGFDHQKPADAREMETRERAVLAKFGIPDPY